MARGFVYLVAVIDVYSRRILAWRISNSLTADFCIEAVEEAIGCYGAPEIFNSDQGSQFTAAAFVQVLQRNRIRISMDGRGAWRDNVFIERLWKSIKYEEVYLHAYESVSEARPASDATSSSTTGAARTVRLTARRRMPCTSNRCRSRRQLNRGVPLIPTAKTV
jgi:transposase InsO family protein